MPKYRDTEDHGLGGSNGAVQWDAVLDEACQ